MPPEREQSWIQQRRFQNLVPAPLAGLLNLALILVISELVWYLVFSPTGELRLYTPNLGVSLVITVLMVIHWGMDLFDFWPFKRRFLNESHPLAKGAALTVFYVGLGLIVMFVIYYYLVGWFGAIFFSGPGLLASGGLGQYSQTATENACYAQIMMNTSIIFFTIMWLTGFGYAPWESNSGPVRSFSVWVWGLLMAIVAFVFLFYPHIAYQFYPPQVFMAAEPWWTQWAMTQSSLFHFGWIVPALVLLYWTTQFWEGRPFNLVANPWQRGVITLATVVVCGIIIMFVSNHIMDWWFDTEAFEGGSSVEQPAWRWNHVAETFMFMATAGAVLYHYFGNWPHWGSLPARAAARTLIAVVGGLVLMWLYYVLGPTFLGTVPGVAQESDTTLAWTVMFLNLIIIHAVFFDGYPFRRLARG
ncbi:MAG: hypothetical protein V1797_04660 [Pseudomonadota bacterium]